MMDILKYIGFGVKLVILGIIGVGVLLFYLGEKLLYPAELEEDDCGCTEWM